MVCLSRPYPFKFFKICLPKNLLSPLLNTLSHMFDMVLNALLFKLVVVFWTFFETIRSEIPYNWMRNGSDAVDM